MKINVLLSLVATTISTAGATLNTERIDQLIGLKGKLDEKEGAYKISFPRDDIAVSVDGWEIPAFMGFTTWVSFTGPPIAKQWLWAIPFYDRRRTADYFLP